MYIPYLKNTLWLKNRNHHLKLQWVVIILLVEDLNISRNTKIGHKDMKEANAVGKMVIMPLNEFLHFKSSSKKLYDWKEDRSVVPWPCCTGQTTSSSLVTHQWDYARRVESVLATWSGHANILSWPFLKYKKAFKIICRLWGLTKFIFRKCFADYGGQHTCVLLHMKRYASHRECVKTTITKLPSLKQEAW